jgi:predicted membrane-bound mannosyltransferase
MTRTRFWQSWGFWSFVAFIGVMVIAAFFRLYRLTEVPPFFNFDEAAHATDAQLILNGHHFIFSPKIQGVEAFFMYVTAGAFALLGQTPFAQRLVSAVVGIATVAATYLWVREMFRQARGIVTLRLISAPIHLQTGRPPGLPSSLPWDWRPLSGM